VPEDFPGDPGDGRGGGGRDTGVPPPPEDVCAAELDGEPRCAVSGKPRGEWCVLCHMREVDA
jgi:hypothetical protein